MDFARKQLEKYGWKEGEGVGKEGNKGLVDALKPKLKNGKEGMGFNIGKDLVDPWWSKAYDDSLKRINVNDSKDDEDVGISFGLDGEEQSSEARPLEKIRKRGLKSNFVAFSKGATLNNGEMKSVPSSSHESESDSSDSETEPMNKKKCLTDEELFLACGGRTAHKGARFGLQLNGKLARIAAQEQELYSMQIKTSAKLDSKQATKRKRGS